MWAPVRRTGGQEAPALEREALAGGSRGPSSSSSDVICINGQPQHNTFMHRNLERATRQRGQQRMCHPLVIVWQYL